MFAHSLQFAPADASGCSGLPSGASQERTILSQLYKTTGGPSGCWVEDTHWGSARPLAEWYGVFVDAAERVESLLLPGNGLTGPLPGVLGRLSGLRAMDLYNNRLTGRVPAALGKV